MSTQADIQTIGLVVLKFPSDALNALALIDMIKKYSKIVPEGRCMAILWDPGNSLSKSVPVESLATNALMGPAGSRTLPNEASNSDALAQTSVKWNLFGTLAVREMHDSTTVLGYRFAVVFRREGPRTFERRHSAPAELLQASLIDVEAKAFTRDFANNVWHFAGGDVETQISQRLSYLLTWNDEATVIAEQDAQNHISRFCPPMDLQQIPIAVRESYYTGLTLFSDIEISRLT
jgi:hypothetical protein